MTHFEKALSYVAQHRTWSDEEDTLAVKAVGDHKPLPKDVESKMIDLFEEYGRTFDFLENWWECYESDTTEIFLQLPIDL